MGNPHRAVGIASFSEEEFNLLKLVAVDRNDLHDTYREWREGVEQVKIHFRQKGHRPVEIPLTVLEIQAYCSEHGLENTGSTRARFTQERLEAAVKEAAILGDTWP